MERSEQVVVVDYGLGNVRSIVNMFKKIGAGAVATRDPDLLRRASRIVLPGVGSFDAGMKNLDLFGLWPILDELVLGQSVPVLGICLGMQLLAESSEEGSLRGLGWISGRVVRFRFDGENASLRVPHMGWNLVRSVRPNPVLAGSDEEHWFYFAHSYHLRCRSPEDCVAEATYGLPFSAVVRRRNVFGVQFHPEKSHRYGMQLLRSFLETGGERAAWAA